jgi:alpha-amylase
VSRGPLAFCFGVHNHQPIGNFDSVLVETTERAYRPLLERLRARTEVRISVHCTGSLLEWLREHARATFDLLGELAASGRVELLTGGFYEPILAVLPDPDKRGQIERLSAFLKSEFGVRPRGMWLAERVWEPTLPRALRDAGVEYVLVDDQHFALTGLSPDELGGYYLTEDQGATVGVFPINGRLRHLIPFAEVAKSIEYLGERHGRVTAVTVADDGEKFGAWPGTYQHVYEDGWLDAFFDRVAETPWLRWATFTDVVDGGPAAGRVYLPTASYQEMGEWALPTEAGRELEIAKRDLGPLEGGARMIGLLRAGFWRNFLVKYPEVAEIYWKMLRLSAAITRAHAERPTEPAVLAAREALWRGQANDAYWHGVFGGCYLPHLRRAVKTALLEAEARLTAGAPLDVTVADVNGDGQEEILVRTPELTVALNPARGGTLSEIGALARRHDVADVLARREETYHARLARGQGGTRSIGDTTPAKEPGLHRLLTYDRFRRASLLDGLFDAAGDLDAVEPWAASPLALGDAVFVPTVTRHGDRVEINLRHDAAHPKLAAVDKRVTVAGATVTARYRLTAPAGRALDGRWAVQWNLALSAGNAPGRYLTRPDRPSLGSAGRATDATEVTLVDEWLRLQARLTWSPAATLAWGPVETVSVSEGGFERLYQGTALLLSWPLAGTTQEVSVSLTVEDR